MNRLTQYHLTVNHPPTKPNHRPQHRTQPVSSSHLTIEPWPLGKPNVPNYLNATAENKKFGHNANCNRMPGDVCKASAGTAWTVGIGAWEARTVYLMSCSRKGKGDISSERVVSSRGGMRLGIRSGRVGLVRFMARSPRRNM
jgi:hypothetical protein